MRLMSFTLICLSMLASAILKRLVLHPQTQLLKRWEKTFTLLSKAFCSHIQNSKTTSCILPVTVMEETSLPSWPSRSWRTMMQLPSRDIQNKLSTCKECWWRTDWSRVWSKGYRLPDCLTMCRKSSRIDFYILKRDALMLCWKIIEQTTTTATGWLT